MRKCFQLIGGGHLKFWTVEVVGNHYLATFGRIGTDGQTQVKTFSSDREALEKAEAMINEKTRKGYREVKSDMHPGAKQTLVASLAGTAPAPIPPPLPRRPPPVTVATPPPEEPPTPGPRRIVPCPS